MTDFAIAQALEHDHRAIDQELERFKKGLERGEWLGESLSHAAEELRHHIYVEEEALFPFLRSTNMFAAVFVMLREHGEIWRGIEAVESQEHGDRSRALAAFAAMETVLSSHNFKEEQILYPASDSALGEKVDAVRVAFEEGRRPGGWVPQNLRRQSA